MTREEAKDLLLNISAYDIDMQRGMAKQEAIDMAIKALEQEPCEDAVSRQAVIDSLHSKFADGFDSDRWWNSMSVLYAINKVPSVSTKKTGRWIPIERELPELNKPLLVTAYHRVCYAHMISKNGSYGYPVFRLHELKDSDRGWVQETISHEPYSKGRIDAWMYIDIPQPYKAESEDKE